MASLSFVAFQTSANEVRPSGNAHWESLKRIRATAEALDHAKMSKLDEGAWGVRVLMRALSVCCIVRGD